MAVWEYDVIADRTTFSPELVKLFGFSEDANPTVEDLRARYLPGEGERVRTAGRQALERGETYFETEYQVTRLDGEHRWMLLRGEIQLSSDKQPLRVLGVVFDITQQKKAAERQALLVDELNHRVRNTLSVVQSITKLTLRDSRNTKQAAADIEGRIMSLSRAHGLLTEQSWEGVSLRQLASRVLSYAEDRIILDGPDVRLRPRVAVDLSLVLHELLTNALKYGSLSVEAGRVEIHCSKVAADLLELEWVELNGPEVRPPSRSGLGSKVIQGVLKEAGGTVEMIFAPEGLRCVVTLQLIEQEQPVAATHVIDSVTSGQASGHDSA
jgi:PAS domain S-box-containing protein